MTEELKNIDRSAIEDLVKIREEEDVLRDRLAKMEASKQNVSAVVYERVHADYRTRLDTLERNAAPLREIARREYAKLKALDDEYRKSLQDVKLEKEEIEFRQQLGEFSEDDFRSRIAEFDRRVAEQQQRLDSAAELRNEFLRAFPSAADLEAASAPQRASAPAPQPAAQPIAQPVAQPAPRAEAPAAPAPAPASAPAAAPAPVAAPQPAAAPLMAPPDRPAPKPVEKPAPVAPPPPMPPAPAPVGNEASVPDRMAAAGVHEDATIVAPPSPVQATEPVAPPQQNVSPKTTEGGGSTVIFSMPKLVALMNGAQAEEYVLSAKTTIGRTSKNDIQVLEDAVSRQHCEVILAPDGYKIIDLGSHNGLSVNGQRVTERVLNDGDVIQIGTRQFVFRGA